MAIVRLKLDEGTYEALTRAAEAEHRSIDMQAEYLIQRAVAGSHYADDRERQVLRHPTLEPDK